MDTFLLNNAMCYCHALVNVLYINVERETTSLMLYRYPAGGHPRTRVLRDEPQAPAALHQEDDEEKPRRESVCAAREGAHPG